ncbi:MAG: hypothetical protein AAF666_08095, partial [Pseudomonadota bacterium]
MVRCCTHRSDKRDRVEFIAPNVAIPPSRGVPIFISIGLRVERRSNMVFDRAKASEPAASVLFPLWRPRA